MSKNKLEIEVFSAWNTYAISMMSVLEHSGMWKKEDTFQKFMCLTGISSQCCVDKTCSALPVTDYDWSNDHTCFMNRIGVQTNKYFAQLDNPMYTTIQQEAIKTIKSAIDQNIATVVWGIDTGEFGVIYGYDDDDLIFFCKGIGANNTDASLPILYNNLGKTFEYAPILYCETPQSLHDVDWNQAYYDFLKEYIQQMNKISDDSNRAYGLLGYEMIVKAIQENSIDEFGFRYCMGIFYERKDAILQYLLERQKEDTNDLQVKLIDSFSKTVDLYKKLIFDILQGDTEGWDFLFQPINKECYKDIINIINEIQNSEKNSINIISVILDRNH